MKYTFFIGIMLVLAACTSNKPEAPKKIKPEQLIEIKDGIYTEYYPGKKEVKITGPVDKAKQRDGKWIFKGKTGEELSICFYQNGKKHGHSIVKYPNGAIHYVGEYENDKQVGVWEFFDEQGKLKEKIDYGYVDAK